MGIRRAIIATGIPILAMVALTLIQSDHGDNTALRRSSFADARIDFSAPIPGELTTLVDARSRVDYPIPTLQPQSLPDPCKLGTMVTLVLKEVWATRLPVERTMRQVGLTYSGGVWISVTPKQRFNDSIALQNDLPLIADAFAPDDDPSADLSSGSVRGRTAWLNELGPGSICPPPSASSASYQEPGPEAGVGNLPYADALSGHLTWMENNVVVHMSGPYNVATLQAMASGIVWI